MQLRVAHCVEICSALGPPGWPMAAVWLKGCHGDCRGCLAPELRSSTGGKLVSAAEVARWVCGLPRILGLVGSGGEPFDQAEGLAECLALVRRQRPDLGIIVYTGYEVDAVLRNGTEAQVRLIADGLVDVVIDGPFVEELPPAPLRGSSNQCLVAVTPKGEGMCSLIPAQGPNRVEVAVRDGKLFWVGIPPRGFGDRLPSELRESGVILRGV